MVLSQKCELLILDILELIIASAQYSKQGKIKTLNKASNKLNILRVIVRLSKDVNALDFKKYLALQKEIDEIGKMLGGWIKSLR